MGTHLAGQGKAVLDRAKGDPDTVLLTSQVSEINKQQSLWI